MGSTTAISWADRTVNPIRGTTSMWTCAEISPGCENCYANTANVRWGGLPYSKNPEQLDNPAQLSDTTLVRMARDKKPGFVFVCSMTDICGAWVPDEWLDKIFAAMALSQRVTYLVLTKRPRRLHDYLLDPETPGRVLAAAFRLAEAQRLAAAGISTWPLPNVGLGTSIELDRFSWRAAILAECPAAFRFISAEPLLGPLPSLELTREVQVPLSEWPAEALESGASEYVRTVRAIDWVIAGGESGGPKERQLVEPCPGRACTHPDCGPHDHCLNGCRMLPKPEALEWVRALRDATVAAGAAYHFKQFGGRTWREGGRMLDGRIWDEFPDYASKRIAISSGAK